MTNEVVKIEELRKEQTKLEGDRAVLNERLTALNAERERIVQQITMIAGALQTINHFINTVDPEVDLEDEVDLTSE
jgi:predicted nuclease with TOPRIM domain|tara:strand:- start:411 stop:638 length:228 start_codon:yes stop_codon:yes gene_type:complete